MVLTTVIKRSIYIVIVILLSGNVFKTVFCAPYPSIGEIGRLLQQIPDIPVGQEDFSQIIKYIEDLQQSSSNGVPFNSLPPSQLHNPNTRTSPHVSGTDRAAHLSFRSPQSFKPNVLSNGALVPPGITESPLLSSGITRRGHVLDFPLAALHHLLFGHNIHYHHGHLLDRILGDHLHHHGWIDHHVSHVYSSVKWGILKLLPFLVVGAAAPPAIAGAGLASLLATLKLLKLLGVTITLKTLLILLNLHHIIPPPLPGMW